MNAPSKQLEALVASEKIRHGGHPTLAIQAMHCAAPADAYGNIKPSKKKSTERIDGIVALVMALGVCGTAPKTVERNWNIIEV
jgi:phage terminase large subunit-like protein